MHDSKTSSKPPRGLTLRQTLKPAIPSPLTRIAWNRDGSRLALPSRSGAVHIWSAQTNHFQLEIQSSAAAWATAVAWSAKGDLIAINTGDKRIRIWNVIRGNRVRIRNGNRLSLEGTTVDWSTDGNHLAFGQATGGFTVWDADRWVKLFDRVGKGEPSSLAWAPSGQQLAVAYRQPARVNSFETLPHRIY